MKLLDNKTILITGASSGIGRATAKVMAEHGANVVCSARRQEKLDSLVKEIRDAGGNAEAAVADVTQFDDLKGAVETAVQAFGGLHVVVPNAGINGTWAPLEELAADDFEKVWRVNLYGGFLTVKAALAELMKSKGNIVCPGAIDTKIGEKTTYENLSDAGPEVQYPDGRVPLTKGERGSSNQVADLISFLASERANHITGTPIWIDGGESLLQG